MKKRVWIPLLTLILLVVTYFAGPIPTDANYSRFWPSLPASLTALDTYVKQSEAQFPVRADNQARIRWQGSSPHVTEYSFVYLHGFAGSYRDGYPLNVNVADAFGANLFLARWAGHGLLPSDALRGFYAEAAWRSAKEALAIGRRIGRKVIILSTSTGGTLAMKLAATYPDSVFALINISPNVRDEQFGASLLNTPWGHEIAHAISLGKHRHISHSEPLAAQYWDTIYPAEDLVNLQVLVETTMNEETFANITCPVLTVYYHKNFWEEDERVEIDEYPWMHETLGTPDSLHALVALSEPGTHFIGSAIKSQDYLTAQQKIIAFCQQRLGMEAVPNPAPPPEPAASANLYGDRRLAPYSFISSSFRMESFFTVLGFALIGFLGFWAWYSRRPVYKVPKPFPAEWRTLLEQHVHFYQNLDEAERRRFEKKVRNFLQSVRITGVRIKVEDLDRLLVASSAVIPLFAFPTWGYNYLHEVLLYPAAFDRDFSTENPKEVITGMVGNGRNMEGVMILSKQSLHRGFDNASSKHNVGIHEFVHILDKQDGSIDGVPAVLNNEKDVDPWLQLMHREMGRIRKKKSDIDAYAATNEQEFLAVASEYFFERPKLFQQKHPKLYRMLRRVYHQNMAKRLRNPFKKRRRVGRNAPCPCGSGDKFKHCCMAN